MPLTELIIDGFKSFANKTTIHFDSGITGIVGPNGSGKSNVTEAIRWCMGESRVKTLRGTNMKDVIFAGSEFRKPLNSAQVTLVFDNKNHQLNFAQDQVSITRKILRSGDSEYLINNQNVRLKDVRDLFLDSGISQNSLAIISQGRVEQILNSKPEDRRDIFEEAAGVLHFKQQKKVAREQLDYTNDNLIRINDLVKELKTRLEPLDKQSSLAKEYKFQKSNLDRSLKTLLAFQIQTLNEQKQLVNQKAAQNKILLDKLDHEVKSSQTAISQKRTKYQKLEQQRDLIQKNILNLAQQLSDLNTRLQVAAESKKYNYATKNEYEKQLEILTKQDQKLQKELINLNQQKINLIKEKNKLQSQKEDLIKEVTDDPDSLNKKLSKERNNYIDLLQEQTSINNKLVYSKVELKRINADNSYNDYKVADQLEKATKKLAEFKSKGQKLTTQQKQEQTKYETLIKKYKNKVQKCSQIKEAVASKQEKLQKVNARSEALINIKKRHEGYYYGVRNILNHLADYHGVIGAVGELISFPVELAAAMSTALGGGVQDLVTDTKLSAKNAINILKRSHQGRATFLPLDGLRQYFIPSSTITTLKSFVGFKGIASDLVKSNTSINIMSAINYLLGSVIIVDTIETALTISRRVKHYRIVTLDGDIISPSGAMTGGQRNQHTNSPLQITAEVINLKEKSAILQHQLKQNQTSLKALNQTIVSQNEKIILLRNKLQKFAQSLNEVLINYQNEEKEVKRLSAANKLFTNKINEQKQQIDKLTGNIEKFKQQQQDLATKITVQKNIISDTETKIKNFATLNQKIKNEISKIDPQIAVLSNKIENLNNQNREKKRNFLGNESQQKEIKLKLKNLNQNGVLSAQKKYKLKLKKSEFDSEHKKMQLKLQKIAAELGQVTVQINQLDQIASRNYDLRKDAANEQEDYSVQIAQFNSSIDQKLTILSEDYSLTYEAALAQTKIKNIKQNRDELKRKVKLHQMTLQDIGPVNLDSIVEYTNVKKRYDFLNGQQNDLLSARSNLEKSMSELDTEVKNRFGSAFKKISVAFTNIFPIVFGGGHANLVLTQPENMLETGVEIVAQPPGKKLQRLSLLSGGERALTAITLLFAMLEINPVPFCVLDEVEAALDDANVVRFAHFLQKYDLHTQFIVITHRRGTMRQADQLFGIVMQESGVSRILSISLKDIKNEVK